jgi:poly(3-hydroxybutyrate) depolymerase
MLFIGYDATADVVQPLTLNANTTPQQAAAAMRAAGIEPDLIITVSVQGGQATMNLVLRKGQDYQ